MKDLYATLNTSKQSHLAMALRHTQRQEQWLLIEMLLQEERQKHPSMSLKKLYLKFKPDFVGRDAFIDFGMENGYEPILPHLSKPKTNSSGTLFFPNLLKGAVLFDINQLWVSDITYFKIQQKWFYIVFIQDVYSRKIIGFNASPRMFAKANIDALAMAFQNRAIQHYNFKLIHHSDKGAQYRSEEYRNLLSQYGCRISMANCVFDNAFMESTNGIMKNEYLNHRPIENLADLIFYVKQDVELFNNHRLHGALNMMTPVEFESYISNIPIQHRPLLHIYADHTKPNKLLQPDIVNHQLKFSFTKFFS